MVNNHSIYQNVLKKGLVRLFGLSYANWRKRIYFNISDDVKPLNYVKLNNNWGLWCDKKLSDASKCLFFVILYDHGISSIRKIPFPPIYVAQAR